MLFDLRSAFLPPARRFSWNSVSQPGMAVTKEMSVRTMTPKMEFVKWYYFISVKPRIQSKLFSVVIREFKLFG